MTKRFLIFFLSILIVLFSSSCDSDFIKPIAKPNQASGAVTPISPLKPIDGTEILTSVSSVEGISTEAPIVTTKEEDVRISFLAVGDNIPHDSVINTAEDDALNGETYNFSKIYAGISEDVKKADIAFINQESPVGGAELGISGYPNFNAPAEMIEELISVGFDVFNIANNHMLDKGEKGYVNTIEYFNSLPVTMIGGYTRNDYDNIRIVEKNGVKIALLSYTTLVNSGHKNDISSSSNYIIPYANTADITRQVGLAKKHADAVIVSMHWGSEGTFSATNEQNKYAKLCADLGVDVVIGHHPHVVGDVEWLEGESGNKTLVAYSLGNFCSSQLNSYNMVGEMLKFEIVKSKDATVSIENVIVDPVVCHYKTDTSKKDNQNLSVRYDVRMYMMRDYTDELAKSHGSQNWGKFTFSTLKDYIIGDDSNNDGAYDSYARVDKKFLPGFLH